ncbi:ATP-binding cassette domain-containing protein [Lacticaseibacillus nasuensis]|uniref:Uncharacterized protein n=1 Tax=Lacticaseibacillus nasuensis JCM 17158 TaxID=1291734 RepID=A0A0R1JI85_9LACO|nr:ABC transporter ATP-binding protein [Lacticaseibacillus nasuensis]KRK71088.1 hypothetical protein FD02_GL000273 [Lacticaseibacillus nasuensis JCM 17158]
MLTQIRQLYGPHLKLLIGLLATGAITSLDGIVQPYVIGHFTDAMVARKLSFGLTLLGGWGLATLVIVAGSLGFAYTRGQLRQAINFDLRQRIAATAYAPAQTAVGTPHFTAMIFNEVKQIETGVTDSLAMILYCLLQGGLTLAFILGSNWQLGLLFVALGLVPGMIPHLTTNWLQRSTSDWQTANQQYTDLLEETLAARPLAHTYQLEQPLLSRLSTQLAHTEREYFKMNLHQSMAGNLVSLLYSLTFILPLAIGAWFIMQGHLTIGGLLTLNSAADRVTSPLISIVQYTNQLLAAKPLLMQIMQAPSNTLPPTIARTTDAALIQFSQVEFGYNQPLTTPLTFTIHSGERVLIRGASGSGKSTLLATLAGVLPSLGGELAFGLPNWQQHVAVVAQSPFLFHASLRFNLALGRPITDRELIDALTAVGLARFQTHLNLTLGTTQRPLSGGELKRLEVARAILAKRQVLLVDEGLSGLDAASATKLADLFLAFPGTLIEVEHHVSSDLINRYDRVIALAPKTEPKAANASDSVNASPVIQS